MQGEKVEGSLVGRNSRKKKQTTVGAQRGAFHDALHAFEQLERPDTYPGLNATTRRAASKAQFITFAGSYSHDWRHSKLRMYRQLLVDRERLLVLERERLEAAGQDAEVAVYQELTNGILASAASEFCQYVEDLAVLSRACKSEDFFARDLATFSAGKMQEEVKGWTRADTGTAARVLLIPEFSSDPPPSDDVGKAYVRALELGASRLRRLGDLYAKWQFHYLRYKHGLLLALRYQPIPPGPKRDEFLARKRTETTGFPVAFDCGSVAEALKEQGPLLIMPEIGPDALDVRWNVGALAEERNLLRHVFPPGGERNIDVFVDAAALVSQLQLVLIQNRYAQLVPDAERSYFMPAEDPSAMLQVFREARRAQAEPT
jgi:hypothetical protein